MFPAHAFVALTLKLAQEQFGTTEYSTSLQKLWRSHLSFLPGMISVYFQSCGCYIQMTFLWCPCCAHARLISAINADLPYTHFPALFSFVFVIIFPAELELFIPYKEVEIPFWQKQSWGVWRFAGVRSRGKQECRLFCSKTFTVKHPRGQYW